MPLPDSRTPASAAAPTAAAQSIVFWVLWAAMSSGVVIIHHFLGSRPRPPAGPVPDGFDLIALLALGAVFISIVVRWFVLPRIEPLQKKLPFFVLAVAMAESCGILGTIAARSHQRELFVVSLLGLAQLVPLFALPRSSGAERFPRSNG